MKKLWGMKLFIALLAIVVLASYYVGWLRKTEPERRLARELAVFEKAKKHPWIMSWKSPFDCGRTGKKIMISENKVFVVIRNEGSMAIHHFDQSHFQPLVFSGQRIGLKEPDGPVFFGTWKYKDLSVSGEFFFRFFREDAGNPKSNPIFAAGWMTCDQLPKKVQIPVTMYLEEWLKKTSI